MELRWPSDSELSSHVDTLESGWSPNTTDADAGLAELEQIGRDPEVFFGSMVDREASGPPIPMPDGSFARRLPGYRK